MNPDRLIDALSYISDVSGLSSTGAVALHLVRAPAEEREFARSLDAAVARALEYTHVPHESHRRVEELLRRLIGTSEGATKFVGIAPAAGWHASPLGPPLPRSAPPDLSELPAARELIHCLRAVLDEELTRRARRPKSALFNHYVVEQLHRFSVQADELIRAAHTSSRTEAPPDTVDVRAQLDYIDFEVAELRRSWQDFDVSSAERRAERVDWLIATSLSAGTLTAASRNHLLNARFSLDAERLRMLSRSAPPGVITGAGAARLRSMRDYVTEHPSADSIARVQFARANLMYGAHDFDGAIAAILRMRDDFPEDCLAAALRTLGIASARANRCDLAHSAAQQALELVEEGSLTDDTMVVEVLEGAARALGLVGAIEQAWEVLEVAESGIDRAQRMGGSSTDCLVLIGRTRTELLMHAGTGGRADGERSAHQTLDLARRTGHYKHVDELTSLLSSVG